MKSSTKIIEQKNIFDRFPEYLIPVKSVLSFEVPRKQQDFQFEILIHFICGDNQEESSGIHKLRIHANISFKPILSYGPSNKLVVESTKSQIWNDITANDCIKLPSWISNHKIEDLNNVRVLSISDKDWEGRISKFQSKSR